MWHFTGQEFVSLSNIGQGPADSSTLGGVTGDSVTGDFLTSRPDSSVPEITNGRGPPGLCFSSMALAELIDPRLEMLSSSKPPTKSLTRQVTSESAVIQGMVNGRAALSMMHTMTAIAGLSCA